MEKSICSNCGKECIKHAKGMCTTCYKKLVWKPKLKKCPKCGRSLPHHAKGLCAGCYNTTFYLEQAKNGNYKKYHNIEPELYKKITEKCLVCGFDKVIALHHLDKNRKNNSLNNMVGLCPNHHSMIHNLKYKDEIKKQIDEILAKK
ncbi:MAG: hypothetical protein Q8N63_03875 [Nanoarchaeota archaeon]|nr:hypothetical protein [Nanoarchaeota archaeon]